jgi:NAD(P)H-flavin reductase
MRSLVWDLLENKKEKRPIRLFWGLKDPAEMFWAEELLDMNRDYENLKIDITVKNPPENGWYLCEGTIMDCVATHDWDKEAGVLICADGEIIEEVRKIVIDKGVNPESISGQKI